MTEQAQIARARTGRPETEHEVLIAGGGPTGLMLAAELALAGIDAAIIERRTSQDLVGSRAGGLSARTLEILDQRGIVDRFLAEGQVAQVAGFAATRLDISDFPTRHNYGLGLWQNHIERILAGWVSELPVRFYRGVEVTGFEQDATHVDVRCSNGQSIRAQYLVGCDGGRSVVRKEAGIEFPGWDPSMSAILAELESTEPPPLGVHRDKYGVHSFGREKYEIRNGQIVYDEQSPLRMMVSESDPNVSSEPTIDDLRKALIELRGTHYGIHSPRWISRFTDTSRQAATYRKGRVLLAGDAAHVHSPIGGQGLNTGVQDATNLGWKLAQVVKQISPVALLDTYHDERHPVGARVLRSTMAQVAAHRPDERSEALRDMMGEILRMDEPRKTLAAEMSGLGIRYNLGDGHPLLGRRIPDLDIITRSGSTRIFTLLHRARPALINFGVALDVDVSRWTGRVQVIEATYDGVWDLPAIGEVDPPHAVLIRPDGYVAWVGDGTSEGLTEALTRWFGA